MIHFHSILMTQQRQRVFLKEQSIVLLYFQKVQVGVFWRVVAYFSSKLNLFWYAIFSYFFYTIHNNISYIYIYIFLFVNLIQLIFQTKGDELADTLINIENSIVQETGATTFTVLSFIFIYLLYIHTLLRLEEKVKSQCNYPLMSMMIY